MLYVHFTPHCTTLLNTKSLNVRRRFEAWLHRNPFYRAGAKVNGTYSRDILLALKLLLDTFRISKGGYFVFQQHGAYAHQARDTVAFLERKVPDFIPPTLWPSNSPDLNPVDFSIWSVLQEIVYRFRIANVNELETRLIDEWAVHGQSDTLDQSVVDAAISQWRRRLSAYVRGAGYTLSTKHKFSAILSCSYQKLLNLWKYNEVLTEFFHSFPEKL